MRLLADENFPKPGVEELRAAGHDVLWARTDCAGWKDVALLDLAESEKRVVLTLDKDFWQIAVQRRPPLELSGVVLFRLHPATPENIEPLLRVFVEANCTWAGHISIYHCHRNSDGGRAKELTPPPRRGHDFHGYDPVR